MLLSSVQKLSNYTGLSVDPAKAGNDSLKNRRNLLSWQASVSRLIETYCNRKFLIDTYTETMDVEPRQTLFVLEALPIISITSVKADSMGRYDSTSDYTLNAQDYRIGQGAMSLQLNAPVYSAPGGLRVVYTGGLAYHATRSVFAVTVGTGTPADGNYCLNGTGTAAGIVRAYADGELTVENLYGIFEEEDSLVFATTEEGLYSSSNQLTATATIDSITRRSLSESNPDLERACEIETRFMRQHQLDFENVSTMNDQTQRRQNSVWQREYVFQPETLAILGRYRRIVF